MCPFIPFAVVRFPTIIKYLFYIFNITVFSFSSVFVPTDGSLPKETKGDVSSQIAGKTNIHTYVNPNTAAVFTSSPCVFCSYV